PPAVSRRAPAPGAARRGRPPPRGAPALLRRHDPRPRGAHPVLGPRLRRPPRVETLALRARGPRPPVGPGAGGARHAGRGPGPLGRPARALRRTTRAAPRGSAPAAYRRPRRRLAHLPAQVQVRPRAPRAAPD